MYTLDRVSNAASLSDPHSKTDVLSRSYPAVITPITMMKIKKFQIPLEDSSSIKSTVKSKA